MYTYVNGEFFIDDEAKISASDRGFRFGDSVFETMRLVKGEIFQFDFHQKRLKLGLKALDITYDDKQFKDHCLKAIEKNGVEDGFIRVQISRGVGSVGYKSIADKPTVVINILPPKELYLSPVKLGVSKYTVVPSSCFPKGFKTGQSLNYLLAHRDNGDDFYDTVMLNGKGSIAETASSNIWWIANRKLYTPSLKTDCINGSVRDLIISNFEVFEVEEELETLKSADSVFITNIGHLIRPVESIDGIGQYDSEVSKIYLGVRELLKRNAG